MTAMEISDTATPDFENCTTGTTSDEYSTTDMMSWRPAEQGFSLEDYTQRIIIGSIVCLVSVLGLVGNTMVILAVVLSKKLQTRTNAFVVNLASADLLTCFSIIFSAVALFSKSGWPLPEVVCSIAGAVTVGGGACSIMTLAAIAINRFVLITKSRETYWSIYTTKKTAAMLLFIWSYALFVCSFPIFRVGKWGYSVKYKTCTQDDSFETARLYSGLFSGLTFPLPLITLLVCYYKIYRHVTNQLKEIMKYAIEMSTISTSTTNITRELTRTPSVDFSMRQVEITKNLFVVVCTFIVCFGPYAACLVIPNSDPAIPWTGMIAIINSAVNPVIYGVKHPHFKEVFRHMLRCRYHMIPEPSSCLRKMSSK